MYLSISGPRVCSVVVDSVYCRYRWLANALFPTLYLHRRMLLRFLSTIATNAWLLKLDTIVTSGNCQKS